MNAENGIEYLTDNEIKALLKQVKDPRDLSIIHLFLGAGLYLNEIPELNIDSIDWKKKILYIKGSRKRDIPINGELYDALVAWSQGRIDNPSKALFITSKGKPSRLSSRAIDKLIRKYGEDAGIQKKVNAQALRNTFAVHLFASETSIEDASRLLGITSPKALRRYIKAKQDKEPERPVSNSVVEAIDKRSGIVKIFRKLIQRKPKEAKVIDPVPEDKEKITVGRNSVINEIRENLSKECSTILVGDIGIGKTHLLNFIAKQKDYLYLSSPSPIKQFLQKICEKYCPDWAERLPNKGRSSAKEIVELLTNVIRDLSAKPVLVIDNLDKAKASDLEVLLILFDNFIVLAAADDTPSRLKQIWWKFRRIDLPPLNAEAEKALIKHLTNGLTITDYNLLETKILSLAAGLPLATVDMINQIKGRPVVRNKDVRDLYHDAGVRYRDWGPILYVLWGTAMASRFVALGIHSFENYILAAFGMTVLLTINRAFGKFFKR